MRPWLRALGPVGVFLALVGCPSPRPPAVVRNCGELCAHFEQLKCVDSEGVSMSKDCQEICEGDLAIGKQWPLACYAAAWDCGAAKGCER
jgi:hypothetical protein